MKKYNIVQLMAQEGINKAINHYGLEKTEEIIKSVYKMNPYLKHYMLKEYYEMTHRKDLAVQMKKLLSIMILLILWYV